MTAATQTLVQAPKGSPLSAEQLAAAENVVAAQLGMLSLSKRENIGESGEIGSSGLISLRSPATSIQTLFVAGGQVPAPDLLNPYTINVGNYVRPYLTGGFLGTTYARLPYAVTYTGGWTTDTLPESIRQAVLLAATAGAAAAERVGVISERMGPVAYTYADWTQTGTLPAEGVTMSDAKICETCKWWVGDTRTNDLGVCSLLMRPAGTVSTHLQGENDTKAIFRCSRHFGCVLHQEDKP